MDLTLLGCLIALHGESANPWEVAQLVQPAPSQRQVSELNRELSQLPGPVRQQYCAELQQTHPNEFRRAI